MSEVSHSYQYTFESVLSRSADCILLIISMWCAEEIHDFSILTCTSMYRNSQYMWILRAKTLLQESIFICFFARNARIFLIITTVHNFILSYLDVQTYLESAAQACWPDSHLYGITDYWFLIYNFLFRYSVSWTCLTYAPWWFCAMLLFHQRDNR